MRKWITKNSCFWFGLGLVLSIYLVASLHNIYSPGLFYDETHFIPAALRVQPLPPFNASYYQSLNGSSFPFKVMDYVGAIKAWLYIPIFAIFPVTMESIRIPNIIFFAATLLLFGLVFARQFGIKFALLAVLLFSFNSDLIAFVRTDSIPFVLALFFKIILCFCCFRWRLWQLSPWQITFLALIMFLGIFHRADFTWVAIGILCAYLALELWSLRRDPAQKKKRVRAILNFSLLSVFVFFSCYWMIGQYVSPSEVGRPESFFQRLLLFQDRLGDLLNGTSFLRYCLGVPAPAGIFTVPAFLLLVPLSFVSAKHEAIRKMLIFCLITSAVTLGLMFVSRRANAPWHFLVLEPFLSLALAAGFCHLDAIGKSCWPAGSLSRRAFTGFLAMILCLVIAADARIYFAYQRAYRGDAPTFNLHWSPKLKELVDFRRAHLNAYFLVFDWGMSAQMEALTQEYTKILEVQQDVSITFLKKTKALADRESTEVYLILPGADFTPRTNMSEAHRKLEAYQQQKIVGTELVLDINEGTRSVYQIYRLSFVH